MKIVTNIFLAALLLLLSAVVIYWIEADKELEVLCSMFDPGKSTEYVTQTLETANLLSYSFEGNTMHAASSYNLWSLECDLAFSDENMVTSKIYTQYFDLPYSLSWGSLILCLLLAGFQLFLALGFPLGKWAWGGKYAILPKPMRIASGFSILVFLFIAFLLFKYLGRDPFLPDAYPVLGVLFLINTFMNFNSKSVQEKQVMTPTALFLYLCFLSLAITG